MIYSDLHRFIFVHVPRTGGTSITAALSKALPEAVIDGRLTHQNIRGIRELLRVDYPAFGFCRNPFSRVISWYGAHDRRRLPTREVREELPNFLNYLNGKYWRPAWSYLTIDDEFIDTTVYRYEELGSDYLRLCQRIGVTDPPTLPHEHNSRHAVHYSEYFNEEARDIVLKRSHLDFEKFGYATELR